ncbi:MAG: YIP1 family protein [Myxococcaceae bacterium]|nr:YIP1 family protein [Myxococcaceae bacterium]
MDFVLLPTRALVDPAVGVTRAVSSRRWAWPLLLLIAATVFSGVAFALHYDPAPAVIRGLEMSGEIRNTTEKELADAITTAGRVKLVAGVANGLFLVPLYVLLFAVAVKVACWIVGRPIRFADAFTSASISQLPIALYQVLHGVVALASPSLGDSQEHTLLPSHLGRFLDGLSPELLRLASVADLFNLWAAILLGFGIAAGTGMKAWKGVAFALFLYLLFAGVFLVGLPSMALGTGGGPK